MLDAATKTRIDSARDILVGKVPDPKSQVEQITIALIYKFMDDMDRQSEELGGKASFFSDGFKKYAWHKLIDARLSGHERLLLYAEGLEKMNENKHIPQLFRDIFKGVFLPYRDPETLNLFLKQINEFSYGHSERLGDAFEYLLSVLGSQGDAGQFRTPRHIIDFIVSIVNPKKNETVLDPACGTAGFLISAYKHILGANTKDRNGDLLTTDERGRLMDNFAGYDISPDMVRLSRANMYLHGFPQPRIHEYDTLTSEERWDERYDVIMANPPFMTPKGGIRPHNRFSIKATRSEVLFVDYIAEHLNVNGRAGVIVPEGIIFQSQNAYRNLRKMLVENYLWCVVSLPSGVFNPYSGVKTSPHVSAENIEPETGQLLPVRTAAEDRVTSGKYLFEPGCVLYSKLRPYLRKAVLVDFRGLCSADMYPIITKEERLSPEFLVWLLLSQDFSEYAENASRRARMPKLNREQLFGFEMALPPIEVQQQIVAEIQSERALVEANRKLAGIYEKKIQDKLSEIWGETNAGGQSAATSAATTDGE